MGRGRDRWGLAQGGRHRSKRLEVPPGKHTIEIRHPAQPPVALKVALDAGEELTCGTRSRRVAATGRAVATPQTPKEQPSSARRMWNDFRKQAGF